MIFQKPVLKSKTNYLDFIGYTVFIVILSSYLTYGACVIYGVSGGDGDITALDVFNGLAAIATASAFVLALMQYRKSIRQQRQQIVAAEAKAQIEKMISVASQIKTGNDSCLENLDHSLGLLSNIAVGFDELYRSMNEDIQRAIIRLQWQDMYYNCLVRALEKLDLVSILKNEKNLDQVELDKVIAQAREYIKSGSFISALKKFAFYERIMKSDLVKSKVDLKSRLGSLDMFVMYYMNKYHTNDLMYGLLSQIDIRSHSPLLAVSGPSAFAFEDHRDEK
ncbi:hypothetical protein [Ectopseudomonas alcaliphila]|uniref:Phage abortive infection protein n=1 Tax=Ectopseudomonas alcaliphila TaxID=101564 RepID=A0A1G7LHR7_9GAMM|nr:hypothetical protein [Pseudomonas alcaliphila]MDX5995098.1 hypothetical protein [Pseudomonas alcaliphila]SDF49077.1 hypothetical protein SAMN05216575_108124 [Pseudomonas alcaliphila]